MCFTLLEEQKDLVLKQIQKEPQVAALLSEASIRHELLKACVYSPFILNLLLTQPNIIIPLITQGYLTQDNRLLDIKEQYALPYETIATEEQLIHHLRVARQKEMFTIAWRACLNRSSLEETITHLSLLADLSIQTAYRWHYHQLSNTLGTPLCEDEETPAHMITLGMGKLGGSELNLSSDIDLIFFYDAPSYQKVSNGRLSNEQFFTRLGQKIIAALDNRTADGFVFRVDMRLRPYGDSGPLVMSFDAAEEYYQDQGREWERYAMLKARAITGTEPSIAYLNQMLRPFIYRRYIDYGVLESLRKMKSLIRKETLRRNLDNNIKLGPGGIREIEFICQSWQLIQGGRNKKLQTTQLFQAYAELDQMEHLPTSTIHRLLEAYDYLRRLEHALQLLRDEQTQELPNDTLDQERIADIMQAADYEAMCHTLKQHMTNVHEVFSSLIEDDTSSIKPEEHAIYDEIWEEVLLEEDIYHALSEIGFSNPQGAWQAIRSFKHSSKLRTLPKQGKRRVDKLLPTLIHQMGTIPNPDDTLPRVINIIQSIGGRTAYLALLDESFQTIQKLIMLCSASQWISVHLSQYPILLDEILDHRIDASSFNYSSLANEAAQILIRLPENDIEHQLDALRHFRRSVNLRVASAEINHVINTVVVADHLTDLAEVILDKVTRIAWHELAQKHGVPERDGASISVDDAFGIIAYGKLGSYEMGYGSDLDIVFLHTIDSNTQTNGARPISSQQFILKLGQRIMHLMGLRTSLGRLYEVDARLRPSGNSGLLVAEIQSFHDYQATDAWSWEHQALSRARCIFGSKAIRQQFHDIKQDVLINHVNRQQLNEKVVEMREKMKSSLDKSTTTHWDPKQGEGGLVDIEFILQYLVLANCPQFPELLNETSVRHWMQHMKTLSLLEPHTVTQLEAAALCFRKHLNHRKLQEQSTLALQSDYKGDRTFVSQLWKSIMKTESADD